MRIGIDATTWWNGRGFGRYTRHLLKAMFRDQSHEFLLFIDQPPSEDMKLPNVRTVRVRTSAPVTAKAVADGNRSIADVMRFGAAVRRERPQVMFFPAVYSWFPVGAGIPTIVTFHDAIAERFSDLVLPDPKGRLLWNLKTFLAKRSATSLVTVSHSAADEIVEYLSVPRNKLTVIYEAADELFAPVTSPSKLIELRRRLGMGAERRYIVYVGGVAPHKNLANLVHAFARVAGEDLLEDLDLVFTGDPNGSGFLSSYGELLECIGGYPELATRIHFTGFIEDDLLPTLYSGALATAMPAFSEGFGLPALEGLACGTPVIATRGGAVEEIAREAGLYFDPADTGSIADVIRKVASDRQCLAELRAHCRPRAACFDWNQSASALIGLLAAKARGG